MGDYISVSDIETITGVTYSTSTTPTLAQITDYIISAEARFENEVGTFKETTFTDEIVEGYSTGLWLRELIPLNSLTKIEVNHGNVFDPVWTDVTSTIKYYIKNSSIGEVVLSAPMIGERQYRVSGTSGYSTATMPRLIKDLVVLYTMREIFKTEFFENKNANVTETIDVDVFKEVTKGGSVFNGLSDLDKLIESEKANVKNRLTTYFL